MYVLFDSAVLLLGISLIEIKASVHQDTCIMIDMTTCHGKNWSEMNGTQQGSG